MDTISLIKVMVASATEKPLHLNRSFSNWWPGKLGSTHSLQDQSVGGAMVLNMLLLVLRTADGGKRENLEYIIANFVFPSQFHET